MFNSVMSSGLAFTPSLIWQFLPTSIPAKQNDINQDYWKKNSAMAEVVLDKAKKMRLSLENGDVQFLAHADKVAHSFGNSFFGSKEIIINTNCADELGEAKSFFIYRELAHIKLNHPFLNALIGLVVSVASTALICTALPFLNVALPVYFNGSLIGSSATIAMFAQGIFRLIAERRADKIALSYCSLEEKEAVLTYFHNLKKKNIEWRNQTELNPFETFYRKSVMTSDGEDRVDVFSPSLNGRIKLIEAQAKKERAEQKERADSTSLEDVD